MKKIKMIVGALAIASLFVGCDEKVERTSFEDGLKALGIPTAEEVQNKYQQETDKTTIKGLSDPYWLPYETTEEVEDEPYYTPDTTTEEVEDEPYYTSDTTTEEVEDEPYYTSDTTTEEVTEVQEQIVEKVERFIEDEYNIALEDLVYLNDIVLGDGKTVHVFVNLRAYGENNMIDLYFKTLDGFEIGQISYNGGYAIYYGSTNTVYVDLNEMNKLSDSLMSVKTTADMKYNPALKEWEERKARRNSMQN